MRFCLITLLGFMMTACLQAVTVRWDLSNCSTAIDWYTTAGSSVYLVQSATAMDNASKIAALAQTQGSVTGTAGAFVNSANGRIDGLTFTAPVSTNMALLETTFNAPTGTYYYMVVFKAGTTLTTDLKSDTASYIVYNAGQYAGAETTDATNGYYDTVVNPGDNNTPNWGDFVAIEYMGGKNVPEPTVFALIALGVAGLALRRKLS